MEGVQKAIAKSGKIDRKLAHSMFVGPTGSGKSSLMDRLLGRQRKKFSASTGVCDTVVIVDITVTNPSTFHPVTILEGDTWEEIECDVSYVRQLGQESVNVENPPQKPTEKSAHTRASARPDPARKVGSVRVAKPHSKRKDAPASLPKQKLKVDTIISSDRHRRSGGVPGNVTSLDLWPVHFLLRFSTRPRLQEQVMCQVQDEC